MTTIAHNPVTDGPLVMSFEDEVTGDPETFTAVQIRIQTAAACIPVDGVQVATDGMPEYHFTIPDTLPIRAALS